jgi:hypothetical protein
MGDVVMAEVGAGRVFARQEAGYGYEYRGVGRRMGKR